MRWLGVGLILLLLGCEAPSYRILCDTYSYHTVQPHVDSLEKAGYRVVVEQGPGDFLLQKVKYGYPCDLLILPKRKHKLAYDSLKLLPDQLILAKASKGKAKVCLAASTSPIRAYQLQLLQPYKKLPTMFEIEPLLSQDYLQNGHLQYAMLPKPLIPKKVQQLDSLAFYHQWIFNPRAN